MDKFGRNYKLQVGTESGDLLSVELPFTLELDITRNTLTSANVCQLRIYNLSLRNRNQLRFNSSNYGQFRPVILKAGYGDQLTEIFRGNISQAWSVRDGVNFITQIECYDGGFAFNNGFTSTQFPGGTAQKDIIRKLISSLPNVKTGVVGDFPGSISRANSYSGNTAGVLRDITGGGFFIDRETANALQSNEYLANTGPALIVNARSGLLGTPILEQSVVRFDMLFEPSLNVGQKIMLESLTEQNFNADNNFNGLYKITGVKHRGMISESVAGTLVTTGEFFFSKLLIGVS